MTKLINITKKSSRSLWIYLPYAIWYSKIIINHMYFIYLLKMDKWKELLLTMLTAILNKASLANSFSLCYSNICCPYYYCSVLALIYVQLASKDTWAFTITWGLLLSSICRQLLKKFSETNVPNVTTLYLWLLDVAVN